MNRPPFDLFRLFLSLFQDLQPVSRSQYLPGAVLLVGYPMLSVLLGTGNEGQAFVTAFMAALSLRIAIGFDGVVRQMLRRYSATMTVPLAVVVATSPLLVMPLVDDPLSCQRVQSLFFLLIAAVFLVDVLKGQVATAASFWPDAAMRPHLARLTRVMVVYNLGFLLLNETLIQVVHASHWLLFWAVLPVVGQAVLQALVVTVINLEDDGQTV